MLSILPAVATVIGMLVLAQVPTGQDLAGVALVIAGVAIHQQEEKSWSKPGWVRRVSRSRESVSA